MAINDNNGNNPVDQTPVSGTTNHKAIYTALIAVIVILGAAVVYLAMGRNTQQPNNQQTNNSQTSTPTPAPTPSPTSTNPTTDWKTYTSSQYDFEFKYPSSFKVNVPNPDYIPLYQQIPLFTLFQKTWVEKVFLIKAQMSN